MNYSEGQKFKCIKIPVHHEGYFTVGDTYELRTYDADDVENPFYMHCDSGFSLWCEADAFELVSSDACLSAISGMSLRDYFAAKAMQGFLSGPMNRVQFEDDGDVANLAYIMADAMLAERAK